MMAITHALIATAGTSLILGTAEPLPLGLAILGSQLPDLDTTQSTIGKIFFPLSSWIEDRFPHRSITLFSVGNGFYSSAAKGTRGARPLCLSVTFYFWI